MKFSVRTSLALIQALLLSALTAVGIAAWVAIENANRFASELALVSRAQRYHQQGDAMNDALRADVNAALLVTADDTDGAELALASARDNARKFTAALDALQNLRLPADLARSVADARVQADSYIARATAVTAIAVRNKERGLTLRSKFNEAFSELRKINDANTALFATRTESAEREAAQAAVNAKRWIIATESAIAFIACLLVALVGRTMRRSLSRVRDTARAIAAGNLSIRSDTAIRGEIGELAGAVNKMADDLQAMIDRLRAEADREAFGAQLIEALEMSDTESDVHSMVTRAMTQISAEHPMELLLSDSSHAHLERAAQHPKAGAPGCDVESPFNCIAVRRGNPVVFENSEALNACPRLRDRKCGAVSAVCVPVSFMGRSLGVLHTTGAPHRIPSPEQVHQLNTLGMQAGARIGTVRAFERTQLQASTDSLTGLSNRRSLEEAARVLLANGTHYAFALADLDKFKHLNDSHGHQAGDQALRLFSDILKRTARSSDLVARWGGEEFAILFPKCNATQAFEMVERVRANLAEALLTSNSVPFTASFGIADSSMATQLDEVVRISDGALYRSKDAGRDRATLGDARQARETPRHDTEQLAEINMKMLADHH